MKKLPIILSIAGIAAITTPVHSQENNSLRASSKGAYMTAGVGGGWASSPSASSNGSGNVNGIPYASTGSWTENLGGGVAVDAGIGYDFGNSIRAEVTYVLGSYSTGSSGYSGNVNAVGLNFPQSGTHQGSGNLTTNSIMFSGYYDFKSNSRFTPYVGAGIGWTSVSVPSQSSNTTTNGNTFSADRDGGTGNSFGYQAKIGMSYAVSKPVDVYAEAIYQGNTGITYNVSHQAGSGQTVGTDTIGALNAFSVRAGMRYRFGR